MQRRSFLQSALAGVAAIGQVRMHRGITSGSAPVSNDLVPTSASTGTFPYIITDPAVRLFYKDWHDPASSSAPNAQTALFLHTWILNSDIWQYQMNHLHGLGMRTLAYDRRGHGRSSDPGFSYGYDALAKDLATFIEQLELKDIVLIGHSMAGGEIVRYLSTYGDARVSRIVLVAPSLPFALKTDDNLTGAPRTALLAVQEAITHDLPQYARSIARKFFGPNVTDSTVDWAVRMCDLSSVPALVGTHIAVTETDFRAELALIKKPTLIIHGDRDELAPLATTSERVRQMISGSRLKVYKDGPHGLMISHMDQLNRDLQTFISES
jgi:non-heme chloroperoxidase